MARRVGAGSYVFEVDEGWGRLPEGWDLVDAVGVVVDKQDRVYVFNRGTHPIIVFDKSGKLLGTWGEGVFSTAHGLQIGPDGSIYCVDTADHTVRKFTQDGKLLLTIGTKGVASDTGFNGDLDTIRPAGPFNRPTNCAIGNDDTIYVSDGYGNCRVHAFSADGTHLRSWGVAGRGPGQFRLVHGICVGADGTLYVGDRQNDRVQHFTTTGQYLGEWSDVRCPDDIYPAADGHFLIAELGYQTSRPEGLGARVTVRTASGAIVSAFGDEGDPCAAGNLAATHGLTLDSTGDLYVAEVTFTARIRAGLVPANCHRFQKYVRVR